MTKIERETQAIEGKLDLLKRLAAVDKMLLELDERIVAYQLPSFTTEFAKTARATIERMQEDVAALCKMLG